MKRTLVWMSLGLCMVVFGCVSGSSNKDSYKNSGVSSDADGDADSDESSDADADSDSDTDIDVDTDSDMDSDADTDTDTSVTCDTNCPALTWVLIPGGFFQMGASNGEPDEKPVHEVTVPTFEMTKTEVTVSQYGECVTAGQCTEPASGRDTHNWNEPGYEHHPVNSVDWYQSMAFCTWAMGRLPSEAEWEYAARSRGQDIAYPWGDQMPTCDYAVMSDDGEGCGTDRTMAVCSKTDGHTAEGLCDMAGNVWEWVEDVYHDSYTGAPTDGSAWTTGSVEKRVLRGGCWFSFSPDFLRATLRFRESPTYRHYWGGNGFRCARSSR